MQDKLKRLAGFAASPQLMFYTLPWLMFILVLGTISQRYIGLYEVEKLFFQSFIIWLGPIPTPGMYVVLAILGISLSAKLILKSPYNAKSAGNIITHMGALLLLIGGLLTAISSEEGYLLLGKNQQTNQVSDYHQRELTVLKNNEHIFSMPFEQLKISQIINHPKLPASLVVQKLCEHCDNGEKGLMALKPRREHEENISGILFNIKHPDILSSSPYVAIEGSKGTKIEMEGEAYTFLIQRAARSLPFSVRLDQFQKYSYPGTDLAEEYESIVTIRDGEIDWSSPIRMNEPLRYKGYTLYQSSFLETGGDTFSVLSVVKNTGRVFPYISSIVMCLGLMIHLFMRRTSKRGAVK